VQRGRISDARANTARHDSVAYRGTHRNADGGPDSISNFPPRELCDGTVGGVAALLGLLWQRAHDALAWHRRSAGAWWH
jgi:hypothetical protein